MKKDIRIIERIAIDSEYICVKEGKIIFMIVDGNLGEEIKKRLRTTKLRLREIYNLLPEMTEWEEYQKLIKECDDVMIKANNIAKGIL